MYSPKRSPGEMESLGDLFPYYAGYSYDWVVHQLLDVPPNSVILDPWCGSGTTLVAAQRLGHASIGVDRHPVAAIVTRLRTTSYSKLPSIRPPSVQDVWACAEDDPIAQWFEPDAATRVRRWTEKACRYGENQRLALLVAIMRVVRHLTPSSVGSNPTWVRKPQPDFRCAVATRDLDQLIVDEYHDIRARLMSRAGDDGPEPMVLIGDAGRLPVRDGTIDYIATSPPYLTRIDYGVLYSRELAVLGKALQDIRASLTGTTLIRGTGEARLPLPPAVLDILEQVRKHDSKESSGYYFKNLRQYFQDLASATQELSRVSASGARAALVVQESYYKEIRIPLPELVAHFLEVLGWQFEGVVVRDVARNIVDINSAAARYPKGRTTECVIELRKLAGKR